MKLESYAQVLLKELANCLRFVSREVVQHDMDLLSPWSARNDLRQKRDELRACMPLAGLAEHVAGLQIQRRIRRKHAVTVVFNVVPFLARPGNIGSTVSSRSNAPVAVFSSSQKTAACCGFSRFVASIR